MMREGEKRRKRGRDKNWRGKGGDRDFSSFEPTLVKRKGSHP